MERMETAMNLKRIGAIAGIVILLGFAVAAMVFSFIDAPWARQALSASLFCAIVIPVFIYLMMLVAKVLRGRGVDDDAGKKQTKKQKPENIPEKNPGEKR